MKRKFITTIDDLDVALREFEKTPQKLLSLTLRRCTYRRRNSLFVLLCDGVHSLVFCAQRPQDLSTDRFTRLLYSGEWVKCGFNLHKSISILQDFLSEESSLVPNIIDLGTLSRLRGDPRDPPIFVKHYDENGFEAAVIDLHDRSEAVWTLGARFLIESPRTSTATLVQYCLEAHDTMPTFNETVDDRKIVTVSCRCLSLEVFASRALTEKKMAYEMVSIAMIDQLRRL